MKFYFEINANTGNSPNTMRLGIKMLSYEETSYEETVS